MALNMLVLIDTTPMDPVAMLIVCIQAVPAPFAGASNLHHDQVHILSFLQLP
jgi:hypothetical protein